MQASNCLETDNFCVQGSDLRRLLEMYRDWQEQLLPGLDFDDFISKAQKLGALKQIRVRL